MAARDRARAWIWCHGERSSATPRGAFVGLFFAAEVYLVLERSPSTTLDVHLDKTRLDKARLDKARLDARGALSIVRQLARILEHMHEKGVVRRGLRSGAVHVEERGDDVTVKLASSG